MPGVTYEAVFVSPHLDDAVFSAGGTIARLCELNPVLVLNVFTSYPEEFHAGPITIARSRHGEEARAASLLGFETHALGEVDAPLRFAPYRSPANLFRPPIKEDAQTLARLAARITEHLSGIEYKHLYLPLGIGWHVDHVLCHLATSALHGASNVLFYEDAPYCLIPRATIYRLRELGGFAVQSTSQDATLVRRTLLHDWLTTSAYYTELASTLR